MEFHKGFNYVLCYEWVEATWKCKAKCVNSDTQPCHCTLEYLGVLKTLIPGFQHKDSDLIRVGCSLSTGIFKYSPSDSNMQSQLRGSSRGL